MDIGLMDIDIDIGAGLDKEAWGGGSTNSLSVGLRSYIYHIHMKNIKQEKF